jgi:hypothetical protein
MYRGNPDRFSLLRQRGRRGEGGDGRGASHDGSLAGHRLRPYRFDERRFDQGSEAKDRESGGQHRLSLVQDRRSVDDSGGGLLVSICSDAAAEHSASASPSAPAPRTSAATPSRPSAVAPACDPRSTSPPARRRSGSAGLATSRIQGRPSRGVERPAAGRGASGYTRSLAPRAGASSHVAVIPLTPVSARRDCTSPSD